MRLIIVVTHFSGDRYPVLFLELNGPIRIKFGHEIGLYHRRLLETGHQKAQQQNRRPLTYVARQCSLARQVNQ